MNLTSFQKPELRDANNNIVQSGTYSVKNGVLANAQNTGVLDYINNNLQAHQNAIETLQTGSLQTKIVTTLPNPSEADANTIYMIKYTSGSEEYYYQYRLIDGSFVRVGDTKIDITELTNLVNTKVSKTGDTITGALYVPTADTSTNNTTVATTAFVKNASARRYDISYTTETSKPWKAIASAFANMPMGMCLCGHIFNGSQWDYYGSKSSSNYGSFLVHSYTSNGLVYNVSYVNGTWYFKTVTLGSATSFTL